MSWPFRSWLYWPSVWQLASYMGACVRDLEVGQCGGAVPATTIGRYGATSDLEIDYVPKREAEEFVNSLRDALAGGPSRFVAT